MKCTRPEFRETFSFTMRKIVSGILQPVPLLSWLLCSVVASYVGPFGTYGTLDFLHRAEYWTVVIGLSIIVAYTVRHVMEPLARRLPRLHSGVLIVVVFSLIYTALLTLFTAWFFSEQITGTPGFGELLFFVFLVAAGVEALRYYLGEWQTEPETLPEAKPEDTVQPPDLPFFQRLNPRLGRQIIRLKVRDHYVEVYTTRGSDLLLMRFSDAIRELDGYDGLRVHRSHWVARPAVQEVRRERGKLFLVTIDGTEVPVSRNYRAAVEEAGLI